MFYSLRTAWFHTTFMEQYEKSRRSNTKTKYTHTNFKNEREVEIFCTLIGSYLHWKADHCRSGWKTYYSLNERQFDSLALKNPPIAVHNSQIFYSFKLLLSFSLTYMCVSRWRVCMCYCVSILYAWVLCVVALAYVLAITFTRCRCCWVFSHSLVSFSFVHTYQAYGKHARSMTYVFVFFGEQEGQLRIVVRTVQTCKLFALRVWEI